MEHKKILDEFIQHLQQLGYSKGTPDMIHRCVKEFLEFTGSPPLVELEGASIQQFYEYLHTRPLKLKAGALSEAMIYHYVYSLKTFFNYLEITQQITFNPISVIRFKRPKINNREPLTQNEIQQVFEAAQTRKERAILHLFYSCGLRRTEAVCLNIQDIHFKQNLLYVREGKGAKRRVVPITTVVTKELEDYYLNERSSPLRRRGAGGEALTKHQHDENAFVLNKTGQRMSGNSYNIIIKNIIRKSGIKPASNQHITLHHLRHSIATHLLENKLSIEYVRDFLGHSHLESTQIYTRVSTQLLKSVLREHQ